MFATLDPSMWRIVVALLSAALLGGVINALRDRRQPNREVDPSQVPWRSELLTWALPVLQGVAAASAVPLFLSLTKSTLLKDALTSDVDLAVVAGLAVIASISSRAFLAGLTKKALQDIEETKHAVDENNRKLIATDSKVGEIEAALDEGPAPQPGVREVSAPMAAYIATSASPLSADEMSVLKVMCGSKWIKRTEDGIKREVGSLQGVLGDVLNSLTSRGLLTKHNATATQAIVRWSITSEGRRLVSQAS